MKMTVYQSDKGDCLLLSSSDDKHMLIDGGMAKSFNKHTATHLSETVNELERICVTHIDQDHIHGIIEMCDHVLDWRVFDFQQMSGNTTINEPKNPRPPNIKSFWHNSFSAQFGDQADNLSNSAGVLSSIFSSDKGVRSQAIAETLMGLVFSQKQGFELSQRISSKLLDIPVNPEISGELLLFSQNNNEFDLGETKLRVIGPFQEDIDKLRNEWEKWVSSASGVKAVKKIKESIEGDASGLTSSSAENLQAAYRLAFEDVEKAIINASSELGLRRNVTTPNLASIMFIAEEGDKKFLFTGDGHWEDIDKGIEQDGKYDPNEGIHFDVIKVPHHGSEHNTNLPFWRRMTADHYVFCSDGSHHNPDLQILEKIIQSREEDIDKNKCHSGKAYKLWFNTASSVTRDGNKQYVSQIESLMEAKSTDSRIDFEFLEGSFFTIDL